MEVQKLNYRQKAYKNAKNHLRSALKILRRECDLCPHGKQNCKECREHRAQIHIADSIAYMDGIIYDIDRFWNPQQKTSGE